MNTELPKLNINRQHIYSALRSAMVDRDRDTTDVIDNSVLITVGHTDFALKREIPSGALLISYMMLFYPKFMRICMDNGSWMSPALPWLGGNSNERMPLFEDELLVGIGLAVGSYAGFIQTYHHPIMDQLLIRANTVSPMVKRTLELVEENDLRIEHARDLFIVLMQDDEYRTEAPVADDYVVNTSWIIEDAMGQDTDVNERINLSRSNPVAFDFGPPVH